MGVLVGINKVALRYQWAPYVHLDPCHVVGPLWLFLSAPEQIARLPWSQVRWIHPPSHHHPPLLPTHPIIHDTRDITETFQKTFTKPVILTSSQLVHNQAPEKYSAVNIEIGISRNTKCAIWNSFPRSSHIILPIT